ncbi:MAG: hypothetical protein JJE09_06250, partial [Bacteroidia bacterium]|nr:hypothetical protein [Bacteroidia bacterium]
MNLRIFFLICLIVLVGLSWMPIEDSTPIEKQKGVCWVGSREIVTEKEIANLIRCNVNWISQTPFGWQKDPASSVIRTNFSSERVWWGESDDGISKTTELARKSGIKTMLKPHLWINEGWPGDVEMKSDTAWQSWFGNYEKF